MSAHHYFRDFAYCDSGMIPWLMVAELVCTTGKTLTNWLPNGLLRFLPVVKSTANWMIRRGD